ncbi:ABC transporter substrate-binding protein [Tomitella gaofuii]|uniref:ABC transporter substrate-binding protein n=1 Tax=Tomitella gaofuii TaxID=2760083 RepID=UPI0015F78C11|nr:ABC transporter substrate-binding protein [Tomitella gaofuii]
MKTIMRQLVAATAILIGLAMVVACGGGQSGASADRIRIAVPQAPPTLDPADMTEGQMLFFAQTLFDSLVVVGPDGQIQPNIATEWSYNADHTSLTMTLRDDATFSDGTAVDAAAVVKALDHNREGTGTAHQQLLSVSDVSAVDPSTVRIDLKSGDPSLLYSLGTYGGFLVAPASVDAGTADTAPIGSGPYVLDTAQTVNGSSYVFSRHAGYWNQAAFPYDSVELKVIDTPDATLNALKSGQIDAMYGTEEASQDAKAAGLTVNVGSPALWNGYIIADRSGRQVPALGDERIRQAINYAIDRKGIVEQFYPESGIPTTQVFNPKSPAWDESLNAQYPYDPDKARALVKESGLGDVTVTIASFPRLLDRLQPIIEQELDAVGITVVWNSVAPSDYRSGLLGAPMYPMSMSSNLSPWTDIQNLLLPTATMNGMHSQTPELDRLLSAVQSATDDAELQSAYRAVNTYLVDQAWFVPIVAIKTMFFTADQVAVTMHDGQVVPDLRDIVPAG